MIEMQEKGEKFINGLPILKYNEAQLLKEFSSP